MTFQIASQGALAEVKQTLETLAKSFQALGHQGMQRNGQTGMAARVIENIDPVLRTIAGTDEDFRMIKGIPVTKTNQLVYTYKVETAQDSNDTDVTGWENFQPQEAYGEIETVVEPLKIIGIMKSVGEAVQLAADAGGLIDGDPVKTNERAAAYVLGRSMERFAYMGGDYFIDAQGLIDVEAPLRFAGNKRNPAIREPRGVQNNIREGDQSSRGVSGDYLAYGNSRSVIRDLRGAGLNQESLDEIVSAPNSNGYRVREAHAIDFQLIELRKSFLPTQRSDISAKFKIQGPDISADNEDTSGFSIGTAVGDVRFIPCRLKNALRQKPQATKSGSGAGPSTPATVTFASTAAGTDLVAGQVYRYYVQAVNSFGRSAPASVLATVGATGDAIDLTIPAQADADYFLVFRTPAETAGRPTTEGFIGRKLPAASGATSFRDANSVIPGYESMLFMPVDDNRVKLALLGNMINKTQLGQLSSAKSAIFTSYFCYVVHAPRSFALVDNVKQKRR